MPFQLWYAFFYSYIFLHLVGVYKLYRPYTGLHKSIQNCWRENFNYIMRYFTELTIYIILCSADTNLWIIYRVAHKNSDIFSTIDSNTEIWFSNVLWVFQIICIVITFHFIKWWNFAIGFWVCEKIIHNLRLTQDFSFLVFFKNVDKTWFSMCFFFIVLQ